jgi:hypothetical protein
MKTKVMQLIVALFIGSFGSVSMAAEPADASKTLVRGNFTLAIYPGSTSAREPGRGVSGGMSYSYYSTDTVDVVYAWYREKLPGGQERVKVPGKLMSYAVPGSKYVNVMVMIDKKGGTNISLSP